MRSPSLKAHPHGHLGSGDLQSVRGAGVTRAPLQLRREASSEFIQYPVASLIVQLPDLLVDILELTDRTSNALKVIGDAYYARLYRAAAGRLGLADWQAQIDTTLRSVSEIYRVLQDQVQYARSEFFKIVIIVLIAVEAIIGIIALRH